MLQLMMIEEYGKQTSVSILKGLKLQLSCTVMGTYNLLVWLEEEIEASTKSTDNNSETYLLVRM